MFGSHRRERQRPLSLGRDAQMLDDGSHAGLVLFVAEQCSAAEDAHADVLLHAKA